MFHVFSLAYPPLTRILRPHPLLDDVTFGKMAFRENVRGTWKNSELLRWSWDLEEFRVPL